MGAEVKGKSTGTGKGKGKGVKESQSKLRFSASEWQDQQHSMMEQLDKLYLSLQIEGSYSELEGLPPDFIRTLLQARNLKKNIRSRAVGAFFACERINQAKGSANPTLGPSLILFPSK